MMPIGSLGSYDRRRSSRPRPRVIFLAAVTALTLVALYAASRHSDSNAGGHSTKVESKATVRSTTTAPTSTTVYDVSLDPSWPAKGTSRYSDSAASKSLGDQLGASTTTAAAATASKGATPTSLRSRGSTTTRYGSSFPTTSRRLTTTTRAATHVTEAPPTTAPVVTTPAEPATTAAPPSPPAT